MAFYKSIVIKPNTTVYIWKISEDYTTLFSQVKLQETTLARLQSMKSESHQKGFLAVRMLLQYIGYTDFDLSYDQFGKPHLKYEVRNTKYEEKTLRPKTYHLNPKSYISISHSHSFSAIAISDENIGIDLEICKEKILKIAPKFMNLSHLENLSETEKIKKATVIWGIKESIFKIKNEAGISFPNHIFEKPFNYDEKKAIATLKFNNKEETYKIIFDSIEEYIFVVALEN